MRPGTLTFEKDEEDEFSASNDQMMFLFETNHFNLTEVFLKGKLTCAGD